MRAVLLIYDIVDDSLRGRVAEACQDFGLQRVQYSAFFGRLELSEEDRMMNTIQETIGANAAKIWLQPLSARDLKQARIIEQT